MKRYADDYKVVIEEDEKGNEKKKAVYNGKFFEVTIDQEGIKKLHQTSLVLFILILVTHIAGGCLGNQGMYAFFVAVPYIAAFVPFYLLITGILRLPKTKRNYRRDEVGFSFTRIKRASLALFIILGIGVLGELVYLIWFARENTVLEWLYLATQVVGAGLAYLLFQNQKPIQVIPLSDKQEDEVSTE